MKFKKSLLGISIFALLTGALVGCSGGKSETPEDKLTGTVKIDGSSTVFPISQAVAEEFMIANPGVKVTVAESGTGGGFKKWALGETDINNASRVIKEEEKAKAAEKKIEPVEIPVAYDGISVVVNKSNTFVNDLTVDELKKIWAPDSKIKTWKDIRSQWPAEPIKLYGPGTASGTYDYFCEEILGKNDKGEVINSRTDYTPSEDDNVLVKGIEGDKNSLGYFGFAYYMENKDKLKIVKIDSGKGPIEPTEQTINDGSYAPLSRTIYIYPSKSALSRPEVKAFIKFYIENAKVLAKEVGYVPLKDDMYTKSLEFVK
ncbi:PstS family phosphate ABC transporter substrate-binding protein [Shimazuella kribbensis]|uniref:PstS family phosphate ABC transporter substrate-binding protein n=1 Tax=Shimazuella kribbensis TaxID=139808 RepID=UPI000412C990|nr:PstS family phosphate ABC transporter substrate-binding protein [Shimazuella kribbensis]